MNEQPDLLYEKEKGELTGLITSGAFLNPSDQSVNPRVTELLGIMDLVLPEEIAKSKDPARIADELYSLIRN
jgi:hypothetical protein